VHGERQNRELSLEIREGEVNFYRLLAKLPSSHLVAVYGVVVLLPRGVRQLANDASDARREDIDEVAVPSDDAKQHPDDTRLFGVDPRVYRVHQHTLGIISSIRRAAQYSANVHHFRENGVCQRGNGSISFRFQKGTTQPIRDADLLTLEYFHVFK